MHFKKKKKNVCKPPRHSLLIGDFLGISAGAGLASTRFAPRPPARERRTRERRGEIKNSPFVNKFQEMKNRWEPSRIKYVYKPDNYSEF